MRRHGWVVVLILLVPAALPAAQNGGAVEARIKTLMVDPNTQAPVVILESVSDKRLLPIWIDIAEARAIALEMEQVKLPRPLTHDLMRNVLDRLGATLERVLIADLKNSTYYALLFLKSKGQELQIDARPSDAMALALRMKAPVFIAAQVFAKSKTIPGAKRLNENRLKLGVHAQDLTPELAAAFEAAGSSGVLVAAVDRGSPAAAAGIQGGDIIVRLNETPVKSTEEFDELLAAAKSPDKLRLEILKKGKPVIVQLELP
jgi:bifunctional DNase/RNase